MRLRRRTRALVGSALAAVAFAVAGPVQPASAAPSPISLSGDATSHLGWLINADVQFPATFDGSVDLATSAIEGEMTMGEGTVTFNALGLPARHHDRAARVHRAGDRHDRPGHASGPGRGDLRDPPHLVQAVRDRGPRPRARLPGRAPVTATLTGPFDPTTGITLDGTYGIGNFVDCGFWNDWITLFTSAEGHTIHAELGL